MIIAIADWSFLLDSKIKFVNMDKIIRKFVTRLTFTVPWTGVNNFGSTGLDISCACKSPCSDS